jgi:exodeoxyribonuclease V alpha subunit
MENKRYTFKGKIIKNIFKSDSFSVYAVDVDNKEYPEIKRNKYKNCTIIGDLPTLTEDIEYEITAIEKEGKYGLSYQVLNIKRDLPTTAEETYSFLSSILTPNQANTIYEIYPNILDIIKENRLEEIDLNKLKGIKEYTFGIIKEKIIDNFYLADLIAEFQGYFTLSIVRKLYKTYTSIDKIKENLKKDPYAALTKISNIGFKTADRLLLDIEEVSKQNIENGDKPIVDFGYNIKTSKQRCLACVLYLLKKNEETGSTKANLIDLRSECLKLIPECIDYFSEVVKDENIYLDKDKLEIALKSTYNTERFICDNIKERLKNNANKWSFNIELYRNVNGVDLSDEQMNLLRSVCDNNFTVLTAPAGTGKSFSTKALIHMLQENDKSVILCSPTGKAAKKLSQYTGKQANTIHRTLVYKDGVFEFNEDNKLKTDVLILDEVGMTDIHLFKNLLKALDNNIKILLIGDPFQLNSVGAGCLLRDLCNSKEISHITYSKVYRIGEGGCLTACTYVRQNKKFLSKNIFTQIGKDKSYSFIPANKEQINKLIITLYKKLLETYSPEDITVISSYNVGENGCDKLNQMLQPIANPNSLKGNKFIEIKQDKLQVKYYIDDMIIQNTNNYRANLFLSGDKTKENVFIPNGTVGKIIDIIDNDLIIKFDNDIVYYSAQELQQIKHSFALSTHKMQGSQNKIIIFCCPSSHTYFLSNNIIYTAISRAEEKVFHFSDIKTINTAMNKSDSNKRKTFLGDMLKEVNKHEQKQKETN